MTALVGGEVEGNVSAVVGFLGLRAQPQDAGGEDLADLGEPLGGSHQVGIEGVVQRHDLRVGHGAEDKRLWMKHNDFSELAQLRVFARNAAKQREVGFREDVSVRTAQLPRRFGAEGAGSDVLAVHPRRLSIITGPGRPAILGGVRLELWQMGKGAMTLRPPPRRQFITARGERAQFAKEDHKDAQGAKVLAKYSPKRC